MCGIAGFWNVGSGEPADRRVIHRMTDTLTHRGPDDDGYWVQDAMALGMRRLKVIDPEGGRQPMSNEDGSVQVVFNGEIYNHHELRDELQALGHRFRTRSDTESIVHAYLQWGVHCLERMNGMFAIAIWDSRHRRLLLARDRLGIKPLYVWEGRRGVVFGSELKAVVAAPWVPLEWDLEAVDDFMTYEYVPTPASIVQNVRKLRPGHWILYEEGSPHPRRGCFWVLEAKDGSAQGGAHPGGPSQAARELKERLRASVDRRLEADVPLGAFLSGGVDSSAIVGLMSEQLGPGPDSEPVRTFSLGFADPSYDERAHARTVADHFGTLHSEREVTPAVVELAEKISRHFDEPFADVSAFPTLLLSGLAREQVTVALSGDGGDELFAGYDHYRAHRWANRLGRLARSRGWGVVDQLLDLVPPGSRKKGAVNLAKRFSEGLRRPEDLEHARWWVFWDLEERRRLLTAGFARRLQGRDCFEAYRQRLREGTQRGFSGLQRQLYADLTGYLPDDILTKVDRMSMAVSLEVRVPFLDHEFVEYAMAIPDSWKLRGQTPKWVLKEAMHGFLPQPTLRRSKEGFSMPLKNWLRGPLRPLLLQLTGQVGERGWFDSSEVTRLVEEHLAGRANHAHRLWCLMSLELALQGLERTATSA